VGLIHNPTDAARKVKVVWTVAGAMKPGANGNDDWTISPAKDGLVTLSRSISVPPRGSTKAPLWLDAARSGRALLTLRAGDQKDADAEQRSVQVQALGREREIRLNGNFVGAKTLTLPVGFEPRDLNITVSQVDVSQSLQGLEYLVQFPYGCV
jgi:hypothetical protein